MADYATKVVRDGIRFYFYEGSVYIRRKEAHELGIDVDSVITDLIPLKNGDCVNMLNISDLITKISVFAEDESGFDFDFGD